MTTPNITTLTFTIRQDDKLIIPPYSGSMLRGAFGTALKQLSCLTDLPDCKHCPMMSICPYANIFENGEDDGTNPYVIRPPKAQTVLPTHTWQFSMMLIGKASEHSELIIKAVAESAKSGFGGRHRASGELLKVLNSGQTLFEQGKHLSINPRELKQIPLPQIGKPTHVTLHFITPFRLQHQGRIAHQSHQFDEKQLLINLYNRTKRCQTQHDTDNDWQIGYESFNEFKADLEKLSLTSDVKPVNIHRHSSRQGRKITLFGMIGDVELKADKGDDAVLARLMPLLWYGQYLHIGKSTTLGLGQYQMMIRK